MQGLTKREEKLIKERLSFYEALETGERNPTTSLQKQFVAVCKGLSRAKTEDEICYEKYKICYGECRKLTDSSLKSTEIKPKFNKIAEGQRATFRKVGGRKKVCSSTVSPVEIPKFKTSMIGKGISAGVRDGWQREFRKEERIRISKPYLDNNWATDDDIKKDSAANWNDGRKNKFF